MSDDNIWMPLVQVLIDVGVMVIPVLAAIAVHVARKHLIKLDEKAEMEIGESRWRQIKDAAFVAVMAAEQLGERLLQKKYPELELNAAKKAYATALVLKTANNLGIPMMMDDAEALVEGTLKAIKNGNSQALLAALATNGNGNGNSNGHG